MERGESLNIEHKYTRRARASGIVIREGGAGASTAVVNPIIAANFPAGEVNQERQAAAFRREADQYMPIPNITRIMRRILPTHARIADDAKEAIQECVSEFISFVTTEANGRCNRDYRSTVKPEDVLAAMASLGFDDYVEPLSVFLSKHRAKEYLERGSTSQLPQFVRCDGSRFVHQPQSAEMVRPMPPPPPTPVTPTVGYYTPLPPDVGATVEEEDEFGGSMQAINEYILRNHAGGPGGEGTSDGREFDPFSRSYK